MIKRVHRAVSILYVVVDVALLGATFTLPARFYGAAVINFDRYIALYAFWIVATLFFCKTLNLYTTDRRISSWREIRRVIRAFTYSTLSTAALVFLFKLHFVSRLVMGLNYGFSVAALVTWRVIKRNVVRYFVVRGFNNQNILIVGAGKTGKQYAAQFAANPQLGLRVVGFLDEHLTDQEILGRPCLGGIDDAYKVIRQCFVEQLLITTHTPRTKIANLLQIGKQLDVAIQMVPDYFDMDECTVNLRMIQDIPVIEYQALKPNYQMIFFKRVIDAVLSSAALLFLAPVFLLIAAWIKLDSPGPVFYVSKRWGLKGKLFNCYKFRSMVVGADTLRGHLLSQNEVDGPVFKIRNDPRLTSVGRFLRRYSLDELPQVWNVFKGDMSIVGPRPLPENERVGDYKLDYLRRLLIKPGLTCLWQVRGRSNISFTRWMRWDSFYMRHWSPLLDLSIIFWTIPAVLKGKGAY